MLQNYVNSTTTASVMHPTAGYSQQY